MSRLAHRDLRVDAVRGVALASMYVAHTAPAAGPAHVLTLSEYATFPLFALLVGVGADLAARSSRPRWWVGPLVRGAALIVASAVVEQWGAQVLIVLAHLGVLTWIAAPLARAPSAVVGGVGAAALLASPHLGLLTQDWDRASFPGGTHGYDLAYFLVDSWPYQLAALVFFASLGILLSRHVVRRDRMPRRQVAVLAVVTGVVAVGWIGAHQAGAFAMEAYDISYRVLCFDAVLIVAITLTVVLLADALPAVARPMAAVGSMTLTLYCLQIAWLAFYVRVLHPGEFDDSWANLALLLVGSVVVALGWRAVVRPEPWRRGPLEGPVAAVVRALTPTREKIRA